MKLIVKIDVYIKANLDDDQAMDLAANAVEVKSSDPRVELEVETIEVENEGE